jgi:homocysteine S-methyltransferase
MAHPFTERLARGPILADGAMGTLLYARGVPLDACFDELNLNPAGRQLVGELHRDYLAAGAELIETNTFGANRFKLEPFRLADRVREINLGGARLARDAREVSGQPALVAGSVGPTGRTLAPTGTTDPAEARAAFREQIGALLEGGVDLLLLETFGDLAEMTEAVLAAGEVGDLPIVAQMTFAEDGRTPMGQSPEEVVARLAALGVAVVGANCSVGPQGVFRVVERLAAAARAYPALRLAAQPNAGWPTHAGGRVIYTATPDYVGGYAGRFLAAGVGLIGGCCGTTPEHTRALRLALDAHQPGSALIAVAERAAPRPPAPPDEPTTLSRKLGRQFVVSVEIDPPRGLNPAKCLAGAAMLRDVGVDAINVADSPMARVRMSALALCALIQQQAGVETILHFTTRDRSLMGLQSDLIGAHALGVRNILALKGDPPSLGLYAGSSAVYDVDSPGLIRVIRLLNAGVDSGGASIGRMASFTIGCAVDPTKPDLQTEAERLRAKLAAGADFVMTQPIYELATWRRFLEVMGPIPAPVLVGVLPLHNTRHAEFLHNEVPGITIPDAARERMRLAGADGLREGVAMAQDLLLECREHFQGVYLMPSFGRYEPAAAALSVLKLTAPA